MRRMMICCAASLGLSACASAPGDFCDVVPRAKVFAPETAARMVATDRREVEQIAVENDYGDRHCDW